MGGTELLSGKAQEGRQHPKIAGSFMGVRFRPGGCGAFKYKYDVEPITDAAYLD